MTAMVKLPGPCRVYGGITANEKSIVFSVDMHQRNITCRCG